VGSGLRLRPGGPAQAALGLQHPDVEAAEAGLVRQDLTALFALLGRGELPPVIDRRVPLEQAALAHELLVKGDTVGKIVLVGR